MYIFVCSRSNATTELFNHGLMTIHGQQRIQRKDSKNDSSIISSSSGKIIMATIEKLIEKLTSGIGISYISTVYFMIVENTDILISIKTITLNRLHFLTDFFLTYRKFLTPIKLCKLLILRFDWALGGDDEERRIVRVRTFVVIRHWLLNYFAYDFIPCYALRTTLTKYLNSLPSHQSNGDKVMVDSGGGGGVSKSLIEDSINIINIAVSTLYTLVVVIHIPHFITTSSSFPDSTITPGTTDSESEAIDSYTPNINGVTRKETHQNIIYSSNSNFTY
ncbi:guanine nucleotide exchange factor lte1 [Gigaspora margarita]|uniref:Guanine nucleotide exchange factor lte1 n=1 Tax=Gigaspora margarita TaxID=4874 RepID=A0A8H3WZF8_GIGMA|nr:guanine nucleotide exchange factor lte1 [Gigaspora margarita]